MTDRAAIIAEFNRIEEAASKTIQGPDHAHITQTVAAKLDVTPERVRAVMLDHWTENLGAG